MNLWCDKIFSLQLFHRHVLFSCGAYTNRDGLLFLGIESEGRQMMGFGMQCQSWYAWRIFLWWAKYCPALWYSDTQSFEMGGGGTLTRWELHRLLIGWGVWSGRDPLPPLPLGRGVIVLWRWMWGEPWASQDPQEGDGYVQHVDV